MFNWDALRIYANQQGEGLQQGRAFPGTVEHRESSLQSLDDNCSLYLERVLSRARGPVSSVQRVTSVGLGSCQAPTAAVPPRYTLHCSTAAEECAAAAAVHAAPRISVSQATFYCS